MKSRSFDLKQSSAEKKRLNKTDDFIGLYKTLETNKNNSACNISNASFKDSPKSKSALKSERLINKKKKNEPINISQINLDGSSLNSTFRGNTSVINSNITSTPIQNAKTSGKPCKVKSIMKNTSIVDEMDDTENILTYKSKKRNKSVSFMLDDNEEVLVKKVKSEDVKIKNDSGKVKNNVLKKSKKHQEKENKIDIEQNVSKIKSKRNVTNGMSEDNSQIETNVINSQHIKKKVGKKIKKIKKQFDSPEESASVSESASSSEQSKSKKGKKKHQPKAQTEDGEPASKARKTDVKPDVIADDLENLSIGDNANSLSSLLDEMTVADKNKHKKTKKNKDKTVTNAETVTESEKEKVKWKKRKWNKDKKGDINPESLNTSIIVENLPISIMLTYKKILAEYFEKCGLIKKIGVAEVYPTEESKPVFTTTVNFYSDGAATQALEKNNTTLEGSRIRVKRPLLPTQTTVVLRTYSELNEQNITSLFTGAGKIRNIRHTVKGKKAMSTAFVEFDGPETVDRALKQVENAKMGGKRVHVARFENRSVKSKVDENDDENNTNLST